MINSKSAIFLIVVFHTLNLCTCMGLQKNQCISSQLYADHGKRQSLAPPRAAYCLKNLVTFFYYRSIRRGVVPPLDCISLSPFSPSLNLHGIEKYLTSMHAYMHSRVFGILHIEVPTIKCCGLSADVQSKLLPQGPHAVFYSSRTLVITYQWMDQSLSTVYFRWSLCFFTSEKSHPLTLLSFPSLAVRIMAPSKP